MAWNKLPKNFIPRNLMTMDSFDLEAEVEGQAIKTSKTYQAGKTCTKRTQSIQRKMNRGRGIQEFRVESRYVR